MALLGLTVASASKIWTVNPTKLDANGVTGDFAAFDGISQKG
jgi:hypothetical protein